VTALVVVGGVPGTGKSTIASHAAGLLGATLLSKDVLEAALWRSGIDRTVGSGWAAYEQLGSIAETQLRLGHSVILDAVATNERIRGGWRELAAGYGARFLAVECVCSDEHVHRSRIAGRVRRIAGWPELTWADVVDVRSRYEPWSDGTRLILDAVRPLPENLAAIAAYLGV
jgi:predicted kinase